MTDFMKIMVAVMVILVTVFPVCVWGGKLYAERFGRSIDYSFFEKAVFVSAPVIQSILMVICKCGLYEALELGVLELFVMVIGSIDRREKIIPNKILAAMIVIKILFLIVCWIVCGKNALSEAYLGFAGACIMAVIFSALRIIFKNAVGMGDVKLMVVLAFCVGMQRSLYILLAASFAAMVSALIRIIRHHMDKKAGISFAPYVAGSMWAVCMTLG